MSPFNLTILIFLAILWGGAFTLVGVGVDFFSPMELVSLRVGFAVPVLWGVILFSRQHMPTTIRVWGAFLFLGLMNNAVPFYVITWGKPGSIAVLPPF